MSLSHNVQCFESIFVMHKLSCHANQSRLVKTNKFCHPQITVLTNKKAQLTFISSQMWPFCMIQELMSLHEPLTTSVRHSWTKTLHINSFNLRKLTAHWEGAFTEVLLHFLLLAEKFELSMRAIFSQSLSTLFNNLSILESFSRRLLPWWQPGGEFHGSPWGHLEEECICPKVTLHCFDSQTFCKI